MQPRHLEEKEFLGAVGRTGAESGGDIQERRDLFRLIPRGTRCGEFCLRPAGMRSYFMTVHARVHGTRHIRFPAGREDIGNSIPYTEARISRSETHQL